VLDRWVDLLIGWSVQYSSVYTDWMAGALGSVGKGEAIEVWVGETDPQDI
jgi:hypothetical protein